VVKLFIPVPLGRIVPPVEAAYQSTVTPDGVVALINTVPGPHLDPATPAVGVAGRGFTVIVTLDVVAVHAPFVTNALKYVVAVRFETVYVEAVALLTLENVVLLVELCHWIVPVLPVKVSVVLLVPVHTDEAPFTVPAATGFTVTVVGADEGLMHPFAFITLTV
jgi:hypothetical protein